MPSDFPRLVDTKTAAEMLGATPSRLEQWRHRGVGPVYVKVGQSVRYPVDELERFIEANTVRPAEAS